MNVNVNSLIGKTLDHAVAKVEMLKLRQLKPDALWLLDRQVDCGYSPSTNWLHGGIIIEAEKIALQRGGDGWQATSDYFSDNISKRYNGHSALVAAMRCFVGDYSGLTIDLPEDFL